MFYRNEGKINSNTYLIDGQLYGMPGDLSLYVIENEDQRVLIDTSIKPMARKIIQKLKYYKLYPLDKIILTHSHWDHIQGVNKLIRLNKLVNLEVYASEKAIKNLQNPDIMNEIFKMKVDPIQEVKGLKDGDLFEINGLKLEIVELFGHTMDSIGIIDYKNKILFAGDSVIYKVNYNMTQPIFMPPDFNEDALLNTFTKVKNISRNLSSIALAHYGVWTDEDFINILTEMEDIYFTRKNSLKEMYKEGKSVKEMTQIYIKQFLPHLVQDEFNNLLPFWEMQITNYLNGLKLAKLL